MFSNHVQRQHLSVLPFARISINMIPACGFFYLVIVILIPTHFPQIEDSSEWPASLWNPTIHNASKTTSIGMSTMTLVLAHVWMLQDNGKSASGFEIVALTPSRFWVLFKLLRGETSTWVSWDLLTVYTLTISIHLYLDKRWKHPN